MIAASTCICSCSACRATEARLATAFTSADVALASAPSTAALDAQPIRSIDATVPGCAGPEERDPSSGD